MTGVSKLVERFNYRDYKTETILGRRFYDLEEQGVLPSITSILGHTPSEETKTWMNAWKARVGETEAARKSKLATDRGTNVHLMLERYLRGEEPFQLGEFPAEHIRVFNSMKLELTKIDKAYGQEVVLFSQTIGAAGRCDLIADHQGELSIVDYKTATRMKTVDDIKDYWVQTAFYALAHNELFGTSIEKLVIIMGVENKLPLVFKKRITDEMVIELAERVDKFYAQLNNLQD